MRKFASAVLRRFVSTSDQPRSISLSNGRRNAIRLLALGGAPAAIAAISRETKAASAPPFNAGIDLSGNPVKAIRGIAELSLSARFDLMPTPFDFGAKGDGLTDDSAALQAFFNVGGYLPAVTAFYKTTATIFVPSNVQILGGGKAALIKIVLPAGAPAQPTLDLSGSGSASTSNIILSDFAVDGGNGSRNLTTATAYNRNVIAGSAILVQSSNTVLDGITVSNGYDNGISIVQFNNDNTQSNGNPQFVTIFNAQTSNNGFGTGGGSGVDVATGSRVTVSNSTDNGSVVGFTFDVGGGAGGSFLNLISNGAARDGFYIGIGGVSLVNCQAAFSSRHGIWVDAYAHGGGSITGCSSVATGWEGLLLNGSGWEVVGFIAKDASQYPPGAHDAISSVATPTTGSISNNEIIGPKVIGTTHRYGYGETATGTGITIMNRLLGGSFQGGTGGIMPGTPTGQVAVPGPFSAPGAAAIGNGDVTIGNGSLAQNATAGFPYMPAVSGAPSGTPTARTGYAPFQYDTANSKLWIYAGSKWKSTTFQ